MSLISKIVQSLSKVFRASRLDTTQPDQRVTSWEQFQQYSFVTDWFAYVPPFEKGSSGPGAAQSASNDWSYERHLPLELSPYASADFAPTYRSNPGWDVSTRCQWLDTDAQVWICTCETPWEGSMPPCGLTVRGMK